MVRALLRAVVLLIVVVAAAAYLLGWKIGQGPQDAAPRPVAAPQHEVRRVLVAPARELPVTADAGCCGGGGCC